jgi:outer membrane protein assembly factor BamE (lipoprotein component of BamABCDE complex)
MSRPIVCLLLCLAGCAHGSASEGGELAKLRAAMTTPVSTPEQNTQNSALVEQVAEKDLLQGLTRDQVAEQIGRGDACSRHPMCREQGFEDEDWYYEVGQMGDGYVRARPVLIVGFDRFGKSTRVYSLRIE